MDEIKLEKRVKIRVSREGLPAAPFPSLSWPVTDSMRAGRWQARKKTRY